MRRPFAPTKLYKEPENHAVELTRSIAPAIKRTVIKHQIDARNGDKKRGREKNEGESEGTQFKEDEGARAPQKRD